MYTIDMQLFAQAGDLINATGNFVNAYTGHTTSFDGTNTLTGEMKTFYDTDMLENARISMYYAQFAKRQTLPARHGQTVEWRRWNTFGRAQKLVEGVIPTGQKFGMKTLTAKIAQYGTYTAITDTLELRAYDPIVGGATTEMGASMAETQEALIRDNLIVGTNVLYADNITLETGKVASTPTMPNQMEASPTVLCMMTPDTIAKAVTIMKKNKVPTINGKYYVVIHPSVAYDLRRSKGWEEAHKYADPNPIFTGDIGELHGAEFIEDPFAPVLKGEYVNKASTSTYASYMFGRDAFGIIDPEGGGAEMIAKDKSEIGGPLNQFSTIGYKFETNGATILYQERMLRIMTCSSNSDIDEPN